jgi:hypothetical protein
MRLSCPCKKKQAMGDVTTKNEKTGKGSLPGSEIGKLFSAAGHERMLAQSAPFFVTA